VEIYGRAYPTTKQVVHSSISLILIIDLSPKYFKIGLIYGKRPW